MTCKGLYFYFSNMFCGVSFEIIVLGSVERKGLGRSENAPWLFLVFASGPGIARFLAFYLRS